MQDVVITVPFPASYRLCVTVEEEGEKAKIIVLNAGEHASFSLKNSSKLSVVKID